MVAYHVTNMEAYKGIMEDGYVIPKRLPCVYLFADHGDSESYRELMGLDISIMCLIDKKQIKSRWKPAYAPNGVIRLLESEKAFAVSSPKQIESEG